MNLTEKQIALCIVIASRVLDGEPQWLEADFDAGELAELREALRFEEV